jgi:integrase
MTKKAPEVKASPGVRRVPNSTQWHYWKKVPADLSEHPDYIGKQWAFRGTLGTSDLREANKRAALKLVELEDHWARLKQQANPVRISVLTPEVLTQLADYIRFCVFNADDYRRDSPQVAHRLAVMRDLADGKVSPEDARVALSAPVEASFLDDHSADALQALNTARDTQAGRAVARRNHEAILKDAQAAAQWLGVSYDWTQEAARPHLLKLMEAKREALEEVTRRDAGKVVPTPKEPVSAPSKAVPVGASRRGAKGQALDILKAQPSEVFLRDVLADWSKHGKAGRQSYPPKTISKYTKAVDRYEALTEDPSMAVIDRPSGALFKRALKGLEGADALSDETVRDTLINCGTLLNYYASQTGNIPASLWAKLTDKPTDAPKEAPRDEWAQDELVKLFGLPVWQRYALPKGKNGGLDAAYWVPLLGLFTGARVTELCQLRIDDFTLEGGTWFLRMAVTAEGQSLKKRDSWRTIPLAQGLIDLGLMEYHQHIKDMGQEWLFPGITKDAQNNAGGGLSKWFSSFKIKEGFRDNVVFHSFRGSLNTRLMRLKVSPEYRCKYIGQKPEGGVNVVNYNKLKPIDLIEVAQLINFDGLNLSKVYKHPAWYSGWKA